MSFSWGAIEKMHRINSEIPTTFLMSAKTLWMQVRYSSAQSIAPGINEVRENPELIRKIKSLGKSTAVWTVDSGSDIELCRDLGVDIAITNTPSRARTFL
jgi:glycerophosphoryl diester phosphodiesterase